MSSNGNGLGNGRNGKSSKKRRRIMWGAIAIVVLGGGGYGVKAALSPNRTIDPAKIASVERGDLARVVVATGKIQPLSKVEIKSKASGIRSEEHTSEPQSPCNLVCRLLLEKKKNQHQ